MDQTLILPLRKNPTNPTIFSLLNTRKVNELRGTGGLEMSIWRLYGYYTVKHLLYRLMTSYPAVQGEPWQLDLGRQVSLFHTHGQSQGQEQNWLSGSLLVGCSRGLISEWQLWEHPLIWLSWEAKVGEMKSLSPVFPKQGWKKWNVHFLFVFSIFQCQSKDWSKSVVLLHKVEQKL